MKTAFRSKDRIGLTINNKYAFSKESSILKVIANSLANLYLPVCNDDNVQIKTLTLAPFPLSCKQMTAVQCLLAIGIFAPAWQGTLTTAPWRVLNRGNSWSAVESSTIVICPPSKLKTFSLSLLLYCAQHFSRYNGYIVIDALAYDDYPNKHHSFWYGKLHIGFQKVTKRGGRVTVSWLISISTFKTGRAS